MLVNSLTAASKFFSLLAITCCILGMLSLNSAKADVIIAPFVDENTCSCGTPPSTTGPDWDAFVACYNSCSLCQQSCGAAVAPGVVGHDAWRACFNSNCSVVGCDLQSGLCSTLPLIPCGSKLCIDIPSATCDCKYMWGKAYLPCLCMN